jgi:hypothetical protein
MMQKQYAYILVTKNIKLQPGAMPLLRLVVVTCFPPQWLRFDRKSGLVEFVVDVLTLGQVFCEYFSFSCQF